MALQSLAGSGTKSLGPRFFFTNVLPAVFIVLLTYLILSSGALYHHPSIDDVFKAIDNLNGERIAIIILTILSVNVILQPFQIAMIKFLEGYWGVNRMVQRVFDIGVELQRRKLNALEIMTELGTSSGDRRRQEWAAMQLRSYPRTTRLLPTRLGNVMRAHEDRAGGRYGLATVTTWPRIFPQLSERLSIGVRDARAQLDSSTALCVTFFAAALVSLALLVPHGGIWILVIPSSVGLLALISYRSAVTSARVYGRLLETAYDLHRFDMLTALHYQLPQMAQEEVAFNRQLSTFLATAEAWGAEADSSDRRSHKRPREDYAHPTVAHLWIRD